MIQYHKIRSLWKRQELPPRKLREGVYSEPEFEYLKDQEWICDEKVDGTNIRIMWDGQKVKFGGKTDNAQLPMPLYEKLEEKFGGEANEQVFEQVFPGANEEKGVCLYGEGYGRKIQKVGVNYIVDGVDFVMFDVNISGWWLLRDDVRGIGHKLGIDVVPEVFRGTLPEVSEFVKKGFNSKWGDFPSEGVIARPATELRTRRGDRIITKLKTHDFDTQLYADDMP